MMGVRILWHATPKNNEPYVIISATLCLMFYIGLVNDLDLKKKKSCNSGRSFT
jgi:hypothetical protein